MASERDKSWGEYNSPGWTQLEPKGTGWPLWRGGTADRESHARGHRCPGQSPSWKRNEGILMVLGSLGLGTHCPTWLVMGHGIVKSTCVPRRLLGTRLSGPPDSTCPVCPECGLDLPQGSLWREKVQSKPVGRPCWAQRQGQPVQLPCPVLRLMFYCHHLEIFNN